MSSGGWRGGIARLRLGVCLVSAIGGGVGVGMGVGASYGAQPAQRASHAAPPLPEVVLTGRTPESRAVEARLAAFVRAVRRRDGARAVRFLSRETQEGVRAAVVRGEWPWRTAPQDLAPLFALPALRLRTVALRPDRARVRIGPQRVSRDSVEASGFYDIGMVREGRWWQVTLPASAGSR
jgi:hypothetical protein